MRRSPPDNHFVTRLKSGKLGVLRAQSTRHQLLALLAEEPDLWHSDSGSTGVGGLELHFDEQREIFRRATVKFSGWDGMQPWLTLLNVRWQDWLASAAFDRVVAVLRHHGVPFKVVEFVDGSVGVLRVKSYATMMLVFDLEGRLESMSVDFQNPFHQLTLIRSLSSFESVEAETGQV